MKLSCNVIKDLLPLYVENISSDDTRMLVDEHINSCESCKKELDKMYTSNELSLHANVLPLKKMQVTLRKRKGLTILFSVSLTLLVLIIAMGFLTTPEYIPYTDQPVSFTGTSNGTVIGHFVIPGTLYRVDKYRADDNSGYIYEISSWSSIWNRNIDKTSTPDFILNPNGETVSSIYYCSNDGTEDILLYGKDQNPNGGQITLPRLFLSYYATLAALIAIILGFILLIFRNNPIRTIIFKFFALPVAYLIGTICIKGFSFTSYSATHDFFAILLAMLPIYCIMLIGQNLLSNRHKNKEQERY